MIEHESNNNQDAIGDNGQSYGYMQIKKKWHIERMEKLGVTDLLDPEGNIHVGIDYLAELIDEFGDINSALMAYNCGPSGARNLLEQGINSTSYSRNVLAKAVIIRQKLGE